MKRALFIGLSIGLLLGEESLSFFLERPYQWLESFRAIFWIAVSLATYHYVEARERAKQPLQSETK